MTLPTGEVRGQWDLRPRTREYLGGVSFDKCSVLEIGPASGYLSFHMEAAGAQVTCVEPNLEQLWDCVPLHGFDVVEWRSRFRDHIQRVRNSFWYTHGLLGSSVRVVEAEAYRLPADLGRFDIGLLASVLLHCRAPFDILEQAARLVDDTMVVTEGHDPALGTAPVCRFVPRTDDPQVHTWWQFTPEFFVSALGVLGFPKATVTYHEQAHGMQDLRLAMFTVVARRAP